MRIAGRRVLLVSRFAAVTFCAAYLTVHAIGYFARTVVAWRAGADAVLADFDTHFGSAVHSLLYTILVATAVLYGLERGGQHPTWRPPYRQWLRTVPWSPEKPLPLGAVRLMWQDIPALGVLALLAVLDLHRAPWPILTVFCVTWTVLTIRAFDSTHEGAILATIMAGIAGVIYLWPMDRAALFLAAALVLLAHLGLRSALRRLVDEPEMQASPGALGWPLDRLHAKKVYSTVQPRRAVVFCAIFGWWLYVVLHRFASPLDLGPQVALGCAGSLAIGLGRYLAYVAGYRAPITLWARIRTGRLIIPRFDNALAAPVASALGGIAVFALMLHWRMPDDATCASAIATTLLGVLVLPPSRRDWQLTGDHAIAAPLQSGQAR